MMHLLPHFCLIFWLLFGLMAGAITNRKGRGWYMGLFWGLLFGVFGLAGVVIWSLTTGGRTSSSPAEEKAETLSQSDNYGRPVL